mmetsp:Transcript_95526/g.117004  ORF Transcript_95526/g.117004 Transcript_95526/m.117004 type:complete len:203 (-) Transcript_95526:70-678(-)
MWHTQPPAWEVCWDFADRQKQDAWQGSYNTYGYEAEAPPTYWGPNYDWTQMQTPWPETSWQYLQQTRLEMQARLQMQAATGSTMQPQGTTDSLALPPSLEKRLQERQRQGPAGPARPAPSKIVEAPPAPDQDFSGTIKSLSGRHGYGFIACDEVHRIYGRDTYLPQEMIPEATKVQDRVVFRIGLSKKGHPQVIQVKSIVPC